MKTFKMMLIITVSIVMVLVAVVGCNKAGSSGGGLQQGLAEKLGNPDISILYNGNLGDVAEETIRQFEQRYGGKVRLTQTTINEKPARLISMVTAGDPPDTVTWSSQHMPTWAIQDLIQPIEDYFDLEHPIWNKEIMEQMKYTGRHYGVFDGNPSGRIIYFNQTLFENNGQKTPLEYYREGHWNWENFRKVGMALTQDTTRDGMIDQWGYDQHNKVGSICFQ